MKIFFNLFFYVFILNLSIISIVRPNEVNLVRGANSPYYVDASSACHIYYYSVKKVVKNCSDLNLATGSYVLSGNNFYITQLLLLNNSFSFNLPYDLINTYENTNFIDLSNNYLSESTTDLQLIDCYKTCLKELNLSSNLFSNIPQLSFSCYNNLRVLNMSNNKKLTNLDQDLNSIKQMPNLTVLDLSYCNIEHINRNGQSIFSLFPNLEILNLYGNRIKYLYNNPFLSNNKMLFLTIEPNQLECSDSIIWFKNFLTNRNQKIMTINQNSSYSTQPYQPTCFNKLTNLNQLILSSDDSTFYTDIYLSTPLKSTNLKLVSGKSIDLTCQQFSKPASDLWWTFNNRVLSKTASSDSPYEFIENFEKNQNSFNKTTTLRIKSIHEKLSGIYSCKAYYFGLDLTQSNIMKNIQFQLSVEQDPKQVPTSSLTIGEYAAIIIGSLLGFLLLCFLIFLLVCCCYRNGLFCFKHFFALNFSESSDIYASKISLNKSGTINSSRYLTQPSKASFEKIKSIDNNEDNTSGFHDINKAKPNYVTNTVKSNVFFIYNNESDSKSENCISQAIYNKGKYSLPHIFQTCRQNAGDNEIYVYNVKNQTNRPDLKEKFLTNNFSSDNSKIYSAESTDEKNKIDRLNSTDIEFIKNNLVTLSSPQTSKKFLETNSYLKSNIYIPTPTEKNIIKEKELYNENLAFDQIILEAENCNNFIKTYEIMNIENFKTEKKDLNYNKNSQANKKYDSDV